MQVTNEDIEKAEKIFLNDGQAFDEERRNFINCIDKSLHLQACPGSGKTTALLAKLYILSEKMQFENNQGICVLTHTNVAINIIKKRLGDNADKLLSYPNFFGTIQSFVDKYLAIPAYIKYFGNKPRVIDTEFFKSRIPNYIENNNWLKNNKGEYKTVKEFILYRTKLEIDFSNTNLKIYLKNKKLSETSSTYKTINDPIIKIIKDGYLRFDDAYDFAKCYLEKYSEIKNVFSSRFKYVFIDEAQDTSSVQKEIIEKCFNENVIIQWIGDVNQGIVNDDFSESAWDPNGKGSYKKMELTKSHRVSQPIADIIKNVAINKYKNIDGNKNVALKPILLVFNDGTKDKVLENFAKLLIEKKCVYNNEEKNIYEISELSGNPIKAVGWLKEKDNVLSIKSYFPQFNKTLTNIKQSYFPNLFTMYKISRNFGAKEFKNRSLLCILEALRLSEINRLNGRKITNTEFLNYLKEYDKNVLVQLLECIAKYYIEDNFVNFSNKIVSFLQKIFKSNLKQSAKTYLEEQTFVSTNTTTQNNNDFNIYRYAVNGIVLKIFVDTVHGVKGETHTATLYLDTKFHENSIKYFINELLGITKGVINEKKKKALKIAHVAFSRPTHLLCIAICHSDINGIKIGDEFEVINI
ncbi:MAG: ATP-dependent helicase [Bacteroidales bacterium]|nr:ATP-dependent helicase [Bacteroidales bacterium]